MTHSVKILLVPGFEIHTYSEIERSYVELCSSRDRDVDYLWLVPDISTGYDTPEKKLANLKEPIWAARLRENGVPYLVRSVSKYNFAANFLLFRDVFRTHHIDAVYTHFGFERFWAAFFGKLFGRVTIWNEHWNSLGRRFSLVKRAFYRFFVDDFISVSKFITGTLPRGSRVHTVLNAISTKPPESLSRIPELRRQLQVASDSLVVLMVAAFRSEKRHMLALDVCERILERRQDVTFIFLGDGEIRLDFLEAARRKGIDGHIVAPGHVHNVDHYYSIADVSILTSHYEPFGYVMLEAMRCGLPLVAFDNGGPSEVIQNRETGFLVPDGDVEGFARTLLLVLEDSQLRTAIGTRARQAVALHYSRDVWIKNLNTKLKDIVLEHRLKRSPKS